jgi:hypothetical protein
MSIDSPCFKCEDRKAGCHAGCPRYAEWREKHEAERAERTKKKGEYYAVSAYMKESRERYKGAKKK